MNFGATKKVKLLKLLDLRSDLVVIFFRRLIFTLSLNMNCPSWCQTSDSNAYKRWIRTIDNQLKLQQSDRSHNINVCDVCKCIISEQIAQRVDTHPGLATTYLWEHNAVLKASLVNQSSYLRTLASSQDEFFAHERTYNKDVKRLASTFDGCCSRACLDIKQQLHSN